jgi:hypothetical protein
VLVDLLDALVQGDGEVGQLTQMTPLVLTLLRIRVTSERTQTRLTVQTESQIEIIVLPVSNGVRIMPHMMM